MEQINKVVYSSSFKKKISQAIEKNLEIKFSQRLKKTYRKKCEKIKFL